MSTSSMADFLRDAAFSKRNPEAVKGQQQILAAKAHAERMLAAGKLTKAEFADVEGRLWEQAIEVLPADDISVEVLTHLQQLASHDGKRDNVQVGQDRTAVMKKVAADLWEGKWLDQEVDSQTYAEQLREHLGGSEEIDNKLSEGDYDGAASERFAQRHDAAPDHDRELAKFMHSQYGKEAPKVIGKGNSDNSDQDKLLDSYLEKTYGPDGNKYAPPPGEVQRETVLDPSRAGNRYSYTGIVDHDAPDEAA